MSTDKPQTPAPEPPVPTPTPPEPTERPWDVWRRNFRRYRERRAEQDTKRTLQSRPVRYRFVNRFKRQGRQKVYVLKGYTTRERITQRRLRERKIRRNIYLVIAGLYLIGLLILFYWIDPIGRLSELQRMLGF